MELWSGGSRRAAAAGSGRLHLVDTVQPLRLTWLRAARAGVPVETTDTSG